MRRVANADATRGAERIARLSRSSRDSQNPKREGYFNDRNIPSRKFQRSLQYAFILSNIIYFSKTLAQAHLKNQRLNS